LKDKYIDEMTERCVDFYVQCNPQTELEEHEIFERIKPYIKGVYKELCGKIKSNKTLKFKTHYSYKGNTYIPTKVIEMKDVNTGKWITSVLYADISNFNFYSRELNDFLDKFVEI